MIRTWAVLALFSPLCVLAQNAPIPAPRHWARAVTS